MRIKLFKETEGIHFYDPAPENVQGEWWLWWVVALCTLAPVALALYLNSEVDFEMANEK